MYGALASGTGQIKRISSQEAQESNKMGGSRRFKHTHVHTHGHTIVCMCAQILPHLCSINRKQCRQQLRQAVFAVPDLNRNRGTTVIKVDENLSLHFPHTTHTNLWSLFVYLFGHFKLLGQRNSQFYKCDLSNLVIFWNYIYFIHILKYKL